MTVTYGILRSSKLNPCEANPAYSHLILKETEAQKDLATVQRHSPSPSTEWLCPTQDPPSLSPLNPRHTQCSPSQEAPYMKKVAFSTVLLCAGLCMVFCAGLGCAVVLMFCQIAKDNQEPLSLLPLPPPEKGTLFLV